MATTVCICGDGMGSLGLTNCAPVEKVQRRDIFVPLYDNDGNRNSIKATDFVSGSLPSTFFIGATGKFDEEDASKRWNITPSTYKNGAPSRTDDSTETGSDGTIRILSRGVRAYSNQLWDVPSSWVGQFNSGNCTAFGVYRVDEEGKLGGELSSDKTEIYPRAIQINSAIAKEFEAVDGSTGQYIELTYQLDRVADEAAFFAVSPSTIGIDLLTVTSMIDATIEEVAGSTATDLNVKITSYLFGYFNTFVPITGLTDTSDWEVLDGITPVTVSAVSETSDGNYTLTITSTPTTDLTVNQVKARSTASAFKYDTDAVTITTPA